MYKAIVFDLDGTLLDSEKIVSDCLRQTLAEYGLIITEEEMRQGFSLTSLGMMESLGLEQKAEEASQRWLDQILRCIDEIKLFPGVERLLSAPFRGGIVTSQLREETVRHLPRLGLTGRFECVVCADDTPYHKPHPHPLQHCLERMGLTADQALYVGDSPTDFVCAQKAGVDFALAHWGAPDTTGFEAAAYIVRDPADLLPLVEQTPARNPII